jgi:hypothetical protein
MTDDVRIEKIGGDVILHDADRWLAYGDDGYTLLLTRDEARQVGTALTAASEDPPLGPDRIVRRTT